MGGIRTKLLLIAAAIGVCVLVPSAGVAAHMGGAATPSAMIYAGAADPTYLDPALVSVFVSPLSAMTLTSPDSATAQSPNKRSPLCERMCKFMPARACRCNWKATACASRRARTPKSSTLYSQPWDVDRTSQACNWIASACHSTIGACHKRISTPCKSASCAYSWPATWTAPFR